MFETDGVPVQDTWCDYMFGDGHRVTHGRLYSPRYPSTYPTNVRCNYHFHAGQHERIKLIFEEAFLQKGDESCLNRADIIKVFDGRTPSAPVLAMLCNELVGYEILSTGPDLLVQFTANSNEPGQGFKANFQFQSDDYNTSTASTVEILDSEVNKKSGPDSTLGLGPAVSAATSSCHQAVNSDKGRTGKLLSPSYPEPYPPKTHCHYDFTARGRQRVRLIFEDFALHKIDDNHLDCESMDSLDIFLYVDGRLEKMASYCGSEAPKPIMSNGPKLSIEFRGIYSSKLSRGFKISYFFVEDYGIKSGKQLMEFPCAFVYNSSLAGKGEITSPNYPGLYPRDSECNYFFYGTKVQKVHLHFTYFDIEGVFPCEAVSASDYVQFSHEMVNYKSDRYCGQLKELHVTSEKNFLRVTFKSNDRLDGTGFRAEYKFLRDVDVQLIQTVTASSASKYRYCPTI
ncbi:Suppressor of lurcher protein 1 [Eumeta japonica]|uniref:Suppressor of lurcher protein 1 n=1 Tax=Eumeta variegata TaxID=151549 RepID=A0A4C1UJX1_EUMVA|nr:Suppressor of lurcher protein 1 [Eumeta japonica]